MPLFNLPSTINAQPTANQFDWTDIAGGVLFLPLKGLATHTDLELNSDPAYGGAFFSAFSPKTGDLTSDIVNPLASGNKSDIDGYEYFLHNNSDYVLFYQLMSVRLESTISAFVCPTGADYNARLYGHEVEPGGNYEFNGYSDSSIVFGSRETDSDTQLLFLNYSFKAVKRIA